MEKKNNGIVGITGDVIEYMVTNLQWNVVYHDKDHEKATLYFHKKYFVDGALFQKTIFNLYQLRKELENNGFEGIILEDSTIQTNGHELLY